MDLPIIGLGTWDLRGEECIRAVKCALNLGYRHIDTAHVYENHETIAKALQGRDRSELYITTKIDLTQQINRDHPELSVEKACDRALKELKMDYVDLYLIHWPDRSYPMEKIFRAMEGLKAKGKIRHAGVSNFTIHHLEDLLVTPYANQVEFHPYLNQEQLLNYCRKHQIKLISYRSLGLGQLLKDELFNAMGEKYNKTGAQVILRWLIQKQIAVIPKSTSEQHLKENINIFDFSLTADEMSKLDHLNRNKRYCGEGEPEFEY